MQRANRVAASVRYLWSCCPCVAAILIAVAALTALSLSIALDNASNEIEIVARLGGNTAFCGPEESLRTPPSVADCLIYVFFGMREPDPTTQLVIPFNMIWAAPYLLVSFSSSRLAPHYGMLCVSLRSRLKAQAVFALWLASYVFAWLLLVFAGSAAILVMKTGAPIGDPLTVTAQASLTTNTAMTSSGLADMSFMILSHALYLLAMGTFAFVLARHAKRGVSFLASMLLVVGSAYFPGTLPLPDITMIARSTMVSAYGITPWIASVESAAVLLATAIASHLSQRKEELP